MKRFVVLLAALVATVASQAQKPFIPDTMTAGQVRVDEVMKLIDGNYR